MQTYSKFSLLAVLSFSFLVLVYLIQNHEVVKVKNPKILGERDDARRIYNSETNGHRRNYIAKVNSKQGTGKPQPEMEKLTNAKVPYFFLEALIVLSDTCFGVSLINSEKR